MVINPIQASTTILGCRPLKNAVRSRCAYGHAYGACLFIDTNMEERIEHIQVQPLIR